MKTTICFFSFLLVVLVISPVRANTLVNKNAVKEFAARVMDTVGQGKTTEALMMMKPYMIIPDAEFDVMKDQLATQAPVITKKFGKSIGSEFIKITEVGKSLMRVVYIQKFEKSIIRWGFYFYRPKDRWTLNSFRTDTDLNQLFCQ